MKELYKDLIEREEYLKELKRTDEIEIRLRELSLVICRVQQLLLLEI